MSVSAISGSTTYPVQNYQTQFQTVKNDFQQLGKDLQSGNLSQAQADYATLSKDLPSSGQSSTSQAANDLNSVGQALQSGNLTQAQQAYANVQQDVQQTGGHHHHHHHGGGDSSEKSAASSSSTLSQDFTALGNDLKSNNLSAAQQAYAKIQTDMQQYSSSSGSNVIGGSNAGSGSNVIGGSNTGSSSTVIGGSNEGLSSTVIGGSNNLQVVQPQPAVLNAVA